MYIVLFEQTLWIKIRYHIARLPHFDLILVWSKCFCHVFWVLNEHVESTPFWWDALSQKHAGNRARPTWSYSPVVNSSNSKCRLLWQLLSLEANSQELLPRGSLRALALKHLDEVWNWREGGSRWWSFKTILGHGSLSLHSKQTRVLSL